MFKQAARPGLAVTAETLSPAAARLRGCSCRTSDRESWPHRFPQLYTYNQLTENMRLQVSESIPFTRRLEYRRYPDQITMLEASTSELEEQIFEEP